ncbi:MAG: hypothetical protein JRG83_20010 [Deltaproteobacteria bacterium]|nr:hypothetical protein [Deltaproteobacteria bacterium]
MKWLLLGLARERLPLTTRTPPVAVEPVTGSLVWHERTHHDPAQQWLRQNVRDACRRLAPSAG